MGWALPIICALFLAYGLFGQHLPSPLNHRGYDFSQIIDTLFLGTDGIYGTPIYVSSTYIFLFILFGAFLERAGMIGLFTDVALGTGRAQPRRAGEGRGRLLRADGHDQRLRRRQRRHHRAVHHSADEALRLPPAFAGGVEATSSMGGQIMPPVMGAVAFIMAETLGVPYLEVVKAAIVPAILYFVTVFLMVHLEAGRLGLEGIPKAECPNALAALQGEVAPDPAARRARLAALLRLHAALRRHGRAGAHRR